jgi:hypothetical protein
MNMRTLLLAMLLFGLVGCSRQGNATYQVGSDADRFTETVDGKTVSFANWQLSVEGKTIAIPHAASTIVVRRHGRHVTIDVNGKPVYQD